MSRLSRPRKLRCSVEALNKSGIDNTKIGQILANNPGTTFNIQDLVCSVLNKLKKKHTTNKTKMTRKTTSIKKRSEHMCSQKVSCIPKGN